jgi:HEAT repeat protein
MFMIFSVDFLLFSFNLLLKGRVMMIRQCWLVYLFLLGAGQVCAGEEQSNRVIRSENTGSGLRLEVRQASLKQVLDKIAGDTGLVIHYSALPEGLVTAICEGAALKQVMECLLDRKADLVFRYPSVSSRSVQQLQPEEVWVLGTKFEISPGAANSSIYKTAVAQQQVLQKKTADAQMDSEHSQPDQTDALIEKARSKNPVDRAVAISSLMTTGKRGDAAVRKVLEEALSDKDANVRAQAISSIARLEGDGATAELQEALHDSNVSVRLMAVNSIGNDTALLQQALSDSDATVRELAAARLELLSNNGESQQQVKLETASAQTDTVHSVADQINALIEKARSKNPMDRVDAISNLLTAGKAGDPSIRAVLTEALSDNYADVRAQAISSLARREGIGATAEIQVALHDSDAAVRLMAVDSMGKNGALLQQALTDSDPTVRELAAMRLESLSKITSAK